MTKDSGSLFAFFENFVFGLNRSHQAIGRGPLHIKMTQQKYTDWQLWQRRPDRMLQVAY